MRSAILGFMLALVAIVFPAAAMAQTPIAEGQVWTMKDAPADTARIVIQKIEPWGSGEAVHISIYGLPEIPGKFNGEVQHMPFDRKALERSLGTQTGEKPRADVEIDAGYSQWKAANAGVFTLSVAEALKAALEMIPGNARPPGGI